MKNTGKMTTIARPYVAAAFEYALARKDILVWEKLLQAAAELTQQESIQQILSSPDVTRKQLGDLFCEILASHLDAGKTNFIQLLAENNRLSALPDIYELFKAKRSAHEKTVNVQIISAIALDDDYQKRMTEALTKRLNRKVKLQCEVDPELLGGAVIHAGDLVIDGSIRGKLVRLNNFI
jgi:F-type H+-transporting ATPase subunit delta